MSSYSVTLDTVFGRLELRRKHSATEGNKVPLPMCESHIERALLAALACGAPSAWLLARKEGFVALSLNVGAEEIVAGLMRALRSGWLVAAAPGDGGNRDDKSAAVWAAYDTLQARFGKEFRVAMRTHRIVGQEAVASVREAEDYDVVPAAEAAALIVRMAASAGAGRWQAAATTLAKHVADLRSPPSSTSFMLLRAPMSYAERITPPEDVITPAKLKKLKEEHEANHEVSFEFITDTGHPIEDDAGYDLIFSDGRIETGKLAGSKAARRGVKPGVYELRTRSIRGVSWLQSAVQPFERVGLSVSTQGFPDGTVINLAIRHSWAPPNSPPLAELKAKVLANSAETSWSFDQALGVLPFQNLFFEAAIGKKRAWSGRLVVAPLELDTPRGLQDRLRALGYDPGPPSAEVTNSLTNAINAFQTDHPPLLASGVVDELTFDRLAEQIP